MKFSVLFLAILIPSVCIGQFQFEAHQLSNYLQQPVCVVSTDLDGDGDMDMISSPDSAGGLLWIENIGSGNYIPKSIPTSVEYKGQIASADLDNDGDLDIIAISKIEKRIAWFENNGNQSFTENLIADSLESILVLSLNDMDLDGDTDVVVSSRIDGWMHLYDNNGSGGFNEVVVSDSCLTARNMKTVDLDLDGEMDIVQCLGGYQPLRWFKRNGSVFNEIIMSDTLISTSDIEAVDLDGDNDIDIVARDYSGLLWLENDGTMSFTRHQIPVWSSNTWSGELEAEDLDNDGDADIVTYLYQNEFSWFENDGNQSFTEHSMSTMEISLGSIAIVDQDLDGDKDIIGLNIHNGISIYDNDGSGDFIESVLLHGTYGHSLSLGDVDGDGDPDIISGHQMNRLVWFENDDHWLFKAHGVTTPTDPITYVLSGDINGDGDLDLMSLSWTNGEFEWLENDGTESFSSHYISDIDYIYSVDVDDIDGDADLDLVYARSTIDGFGRVVWLENDGLGNYTNHVLTMAGSDHQDAHIVDFDGDGDMDITYIHGTIRLFENDGSQNFTLVPIVGTSGATVHCPIDFDGDSDMDVVYYLSNLEKLAWLVNDGAVMFTDSLIVSVDAGESKLAIEDMDADGDLDIVMTNPISGELAIVENAGNGSYNLHVIHDGGIHYATLVFAEDLNSDGSMDLVAHTQSGLTWFENLGISTGANTPINNSVGVRIYPNPFANSTTIQFNVPVRSQVEITVHDATGRQIRSLLDRRLSAGEHRVELDGEGLPNGIYFCRLRVGDSVVTKKITLLR